MNRMDFFQVGGSLERGHPSYVERPADTGLIQSIQKGEIPLILAPRQTGKSSLMVHALEKLENRNIGWAVVDLQPLGSHRELNAWFGDVIYQVERTLGLSCDTLQWWEEHHRLGPTQRFMAFVEDVILGQIDGRVVLFFDEIDSVLPLPFSDDFFTTLRALANARASNPTLKRITFALLGVATPSEFIKDRSRTPFNIGKQIPLTDFDPEHAAPFKRVLGPSSAPVVDRIFYWTAGQPLMVQALAEKIHALPEADRTVDQLDDAVQAAYLDVRIDKSTHLSFIRDYLLDDNHHPRKSLKTYRTITDGAVVRHDEKSPVHSRLLLSGVVRLDNGCLKPRNRIYRHVFDRQWIKENTPRDRVKMAAYASSTALVLVLLWFFLIQPLAFPKFTKNQRYPWFDVDIHYVTQADITLPIAMPLSDPRKITMNEKTLELQGDGDTTKAGQLPIDFNELKIGPNPFWIRFYGGLWKENFETHLLIVVFPMSHWKMPDNLEMVPVPAGCFDMGCGDWTDRCSDDEKPVHHVCLSAFEIGKFEVIQDQWTAIMGYNPSGFKGNGRLPVDNVSWEDAQEFIRRLNRFSGGQYRLPTEAQWEYAARSAGKPEKYAGGSNLDKLGWYDANSGGRSHPVGGKAPNGLGIYDMSGNVWEWVEDDWHDSYEGAPKDGSAWIAKSWGSYRVIRGGCWLDSAGYCRSASRVRVEPDNRGYVLGFRLVLPPGQPGEPGQTSRPEE